MRHPFKQTNMLAEAKNTQKGFSWGMELLIFLAIFFGAQLLQSIPYSIATVVWVFTADGVMESITTPLLNGDTAGYVESIDKVLNSMPDWLMIVQLFSTVLATMLAIFFCRIIEKRSAASMGLRRGGILREYFVGCGIGILLISACVGLAWLCGGYTFRTSEFSVGVWSLYLIGFLIQGMSEEVLCRGYLMVSISRKNPLWLAVVANAVMFALLHVFNPGIGIIPLLNIALFGAIASVYALKRGNLWGVCAIHSLWNFFQGNVFGISVSGMGISVSPLQATPQNGLAWLHGGSFGVEGGLVTTFVLTAALLVTIFLMPTNQKELAPVEMSE